MPKDRQVRQLLTKHGIDNDDLADEISTMITDAEFEALFGPEDEAVIELTKALPNEKH